MSKINDRIGKWIIKENIASLLHETRLIIMLSSNLYRVEF